MAKWKKLVYKLFSICKRCREKWKWSWTTVNSHWNMVPFPKWTIFHTDVWSTNILQAFFDVALETIWVYESKSFAEIYNFPWTRLVCCSKESVLMKLLPGILPQHFFTMCQWPCLSCRSPWFRSYYRTKKLGQNPTGFLKNVSCWTRVVKRILYSRDSLNTISPGSVHNEPIYFGLYHH